MLRLGRVTPATVQVLEALVSGGDVIWGLWIVRVTGRPAGSVYPILARLEESGWVTSRWEDSVERGPRRRLYELTGEGRAAAEVLVARIGLEQAPASLRSRVGGPELGLL